MFNDMLPIALQSGIKVLDYWFMTYIEIIDTIKAFREVERQRIREVASFNHSLANLIALSMARLENDKAEYPTLKQSFPGLFNDIDDTPKQQNSEVMKERFLRYADANNKKMR